MVARITEAADVANAMPERLSNRRTTLKSNSGFANHATYENPNSKQTKPIRKLESPWLNINVLKPRDERNKTAARTIPATRGIKVLCFGAVLS